MSYGSYSYGSAPFGGAAAGGDVSLIPSTQALATTLHMPVWVAKHSNPATFALGVAIQAPTVKVTQAVSTFALSLSLVVSESEVEQGPALFPLTLQQHAPTVSISFVPSTLALAVSFVVATPEVQKEPALFPLALTLESATVVINISVTQRGDSVFMLGLKSPRSPHWTDLTPRIVRYIKDPIVTGGCAQCGSFMYAAVRGRPVEGELVRSGRNFDLNGGYPENRYVRCGRCGWINHPTRDRQDKDGSYVGWGLRYDEVEAGS